MRSFPTIVETIRQMWREPIEIMVAMGHGRSYGQNSAVLGRKISGIFPCALWRDLHLRAPLPTTALITDIGNDFLYGTTPDRLLEWVRGCLDQLAEHDSRTIVTQLPIDSIEGLGERRFHLFRRALFPRSTLTLADAKWLVREMNDRLLTAGESRKISVIPVRSTWYGVDPIHIKRSAEREAWPTLLASWRGDGAVISIPRRSLLTTAYLATLAPLEWSRFGIARRMMQPCARFFDGTKISLY